MSVTVTNWGDEIVYENRNGVERFFAPDTLGSTAMLLDPTGTVTDTFTYWPYGEFISHTGTSSTTFTYVGTLGYYFDAVVNWFYVRARVFRQTLGTWLTVDPIWPDETAYSYCLNSPIIFIDPSGLSVSFKKSECRDMCRSLFRKSGDISACIAICNDLGGSNCEALKSKCKHMHRHGEPGENICDLLVKGLCSPPVFPIIVRNPQPNPVPVRVPRGNNFSRNAAITEGIAVGCYCAWEVGKWVVAGLCAGPTGGTSLGIAAALP